MNTRQKVLLAISTVLVANAARNYLQVVKVERKKREEISEKLTNDLAALRVAAARVHDNIRAGKYDGMNIDGLMQDFEFEIIRAHNE